MSAVTPDNLLSVTRLLPVPYPTVPVTHVKSFIWTGGPPYDDDDARSLGSADGREGLAFVCRATASAAAPPFTAGLHC